MKMSTEQFTQYAANPQLADPWVRNAFSVPENRYYTVSVWPPEHAGNVHINHALSRVVRSAKISKSNQHEKVQKSGG